MSTYGDIHVVEASNPEIAYSARLIKPWDATVYDFIEKNVLVADGLLVNRGFIKRVVLIEGSIDMPENVKVFKPLTVVSDSEPPIA